MQIPECLTGLVGVSDKDCPCTTPGRPSNYNTAKSRLYLDAKMDMVLSATGADCGQTMWGLGAQAIERATRDYLSAQFRCWSEHNDQREPSRFYVGERQFNGGKPLPNSFAGLLIAPNQHIEEGEITIHSIDTAFTTTGTDNVTVMLWDSVTDTMLWSVPLDTTANTLHRNPLTGVAPIPFRIPYSQEPRYYLVYEVGSMVPLDSECFCSCNSQQARMEEWATIQGVQGDDLVVRNDWTRNSYNNGLFLDMTVACNPLRAVCSPTKPLNVEQNADHMQVAEAIYFKALVNLAEDMLKRKAFTGYTGWDIERMVTMRNLWSQEFAERMKHLCERMKPGTCFTCKEGSYGMASLSD